MLPCPRRSDMISRHLIANRFELYDLPGRGGMGEVYRATDMQTGEIVAVKVLNPEILKDDPTLLERFSVKEKPCFDR